MAENDNWNTRGQVAHRQLEAYTGQIASADQHVGGASAAAVAGALAASAAELVVSLTISGNRSKAPEQSAASLNELKSLRVQLFTAADRDEQVLERLMAAYKRKSDDLSGLLHEAAETTLHVAELASRVVQISAEEAPHASRFTVSDLGAAAALAAGSVTAALVTARINIALLSRPESGAVTDARAEYASRANDVERATDEARTRALEITESRITPKRKASS